MSETSKVFGVFASVTSPFKGYKNLLQYVSVLVRHTNGEKISKKAIPRAN